MSVSRLNIGSAKPGVCTSSTRPANPYEGQLIYETDTDRIWFYSGSTWKLISGPVPRVRAYNSSGVSVSNATPTLLTMNAERWDSDSIHSTSSNTERFVIPTGLGGLWHFGAMCYIANATVGVSLNAEIVIVANASGVRVAWSNSDIANGQDCVLTCSGDIEIAAGDYVYLSGYQTNSAVGATTLGNTPFGFEMWGHYVGPI